MPKGKTLAEMVARGTKAAALLTATQSSREGKKKITFLLDPAQHNELRRLALDLNRSAEAIVLEGVQAVLAKYAARKLGGKR